MAKKKSKIEKAIESAVEFMSPKLKAPEKKEDPKKKVVDKKTEKELKREELQKRSDEVMTVIDTKKKH